MTEEPRAPTEAQRELLEELERLAAAAHRAETLEASLASLARAGELVEKLRTRLATGSGRTLVVRPEPGGGASEEPFDV